MKKTLVSNHIKDPGNFFAPALSKSLFTAEQQSFPAVTTKIKPGDLFASVFVSQPLDYGFLVEREKKKK